VAGPSSLEAVTVELRRMVAGETTPDASAEEVRDLLWAALCGGADAALAWARATRDEAALVSAHPILLLPEFPGVIRTLDRIAAQVTGGAVDPNVAVRAAALEAFQRGLRRDQPDAWAYLTTRLGIDMVDEVVADIQSQAPTHPPADHALALVRACASLAAADPILAPGNEELRTKALLKAAQSAMGVTKLRGDPDGSLARSIVALLREAAGRMTPGDERRRLEEAAARIEQRTGPPPPDDAPPGDPPPDDAPPGDPLPGPPPPGDAPSARGPTPDTPPGGEADPATWVRRGDALLTRAEGPGTYDEAIRSYDAALERDGQSVGAWVGLARAYAGRGLWDEAGQCARHALTLEPTNDTARAIAARADTEAT
jgi:tetratricopeptide (TPR) repeat protein